MTMIEQDFMTTIIQKAKEIAKQLKIANKLKVYELKHQVSKDGTTVDEDLSDIAEEIDG